MNLNPDRSPLTDAQLEALAIEALTSKEVTRETATEKVTDMSAALHNPNLIRSFLLDTSMKLRFEMMGRGELILDTSEPFVPEPRAFDVDPEILAFLLTAKTGANV